MRFVDKIIQDIEVAFEPLRSFQFGEQDFEIEIPFSRDNDKFWVSLNNELNSKGISYKLLDTYETDKSTIYYIMLRRKWKPEYYDEGVNRKLKLYIKESTNWVSTTCPVYKVEHYKKIEKFIKDLIDRGYPISSTIIIKQWNDHFERDRKDKEKTKKYHSEWFQDVEPIGTIEFNCRDFDNNYNSKSERKVLQYCAKIKNE